MADALELALLVLSPELVEGDNLPKREALQQAIGSEPLRPAAH